MKNFNPSTPNGTNESLKLALSDGGNPVLNTRYQVPARCGRAVIVKKDQYLKIINPTGTQVCDFWCFSKANPEEYLSMEHVHTDLLSIFPKVGDSLVTNTREKILTIIEDSSPGVHDTIIASCDHARYQQLGCTEYHDNCTDNLRMALMAINSQAPAIPSPFNLWMNVPVAGNGNVSFAAPVSKPGDYVIFKAEKDCIAVMSACPQDVTPVNGNECIISDLEFIVSS